MANSNDMPEFHSVKVSLTENTRVCPRPPAMNASNRDFAGSCAPLVIKGGRYHV